MAVMVIGRPIRDAKDPKAVAQKIAERLGTFYNPPVKSIIPIFDTIPLCDIFWKSTFSLNLRYRRIVSCPPARELFRTPHHWCCFSYRHCS